MTCGKLNPQNIFIYIIYINIYIYFFCLYQLPYFQIRNLGCNSFLVPHLPQISVLSVPLPKHLKELISFPYMLYSKLSSLTNSLLFWSYLTKSVQPPEQPFQNTNLASPYPLEDNLYLPNGFSDKVQARQPTKAFHDQILPASCLPPPSINFCWVTPKCLSSTVDTIYMVHVPSARHTSSVQLCSGLSSCRQSSSAPRQAQVPLSYSTNIARK